MSKINESRMNKDYRLLILGALILGFLVGLLPWKSILQDEKIFIVFFSGGFATVGAIAGALIGSKSAARQIEEESKRQKNSRLFESKKLAYEKAIAQFTKMQRIKFQTKEEGLAKDFWEKVTPEQWEKVSNEYDSAMAELFLYAGDTLESLVQEMIQCFQKQPVKEGNNEAQLLRMKIIKEMRRELEVTDYQKKF